ncbi:hypothetical protein IHC92_17380 [Photobacterium damselae subsp. damselae]|uniref:hypothetical protein n=1 Tax=Photobacterium damselae TaxID=38293 RepID=UPI001F3D380A|nr:hypothetical protein [Photobacterium damselae]UKA08863.1 hypothetical protein IHC90_17815 [Photobacterium damselae subsp. damselae]UKA23934.1 hypothetical protein IHC92_17380 [Photobacterium damselae subsp. damselae]
MFLINNIKNIGLAILLIITVVLGAKSVVYRAEMMAFKQKEEQLNIKVHELLSINVTSQRQIKRLVDERNQIDNIMLAREKKRNDESKELKDTVALMQKKLQNQHCMDASYPNAVIKQLQQPY